MAIPCGKLTFANTYIDTTFMGGLKNRLVINVNNNNFSVLFQHTFAETLVARN